MNKSTVTTAIAILLIAGLGAFLRFYQLDSLVPILNRDEAALAYNALLLNQAGVDEWGESWNFTLQSFGDYKLIGYPTLLVGLFKIFQASDFWVRLPSAVAGVGIILISYPLARVFRLSRNSRILFSLVVALAPFAIFYSRFAYEANVALYYVLLALFLMLKPFANSQLACHAEHKSNNIVTLNLFQGFIKNIASYLSIRKRLILDFLAVAFLVLACFTYNSPLILFLPIVIIVAISRIHDGCKSWLPLLIMGGVAWLGVVWAIYPVITQKSGISLMTDALVASQLADYRQSLPNLLKPYLGNQYVYWAQLAGQNAIKSISPEFLLTKIFHPWHGVPKNGQLLGPVVIVGWISLVWLGLRLFIDLMKTLKFLFFNKTSTRSSQHISIWKFLKQLKAVNQDQDSSRRLAAQHNEYHETVEISNSAHNGDWVDQNDGQYIPNQNSNKSLGGLFADTKFILLALLVISLMPAVITVDAPHATRSLLFLYLFCLTFVWGVEQFWLVTKRYVHKQPANNIIHYLLLTVMAILIFGFACMYLQDLCGRYRLEAKSIFQSGITDIMAQLPDQGQVAVLDPEGYDYIRWAWYSKLSPADFLSTVKRRPPSVAGLRYGEQMGRFRFIDQTANRLNTDVHLVQWNEDKARWEVSP